MQISLPSDEIPVPSLIEHSNLKPIPNPCSVISGLHQTDYGAYIGYLLDETTNSRHGLFPSMSSPVLRDQYFFTKLRQVLSSKGNSAPQLSQEQRLRTAVYSATSIMRFHGTAWLGKHLGKDDIAFLCIGNGSTASEHSYIVKPTSRPPKYPTMLSNLESACRNKTIFNLGVLLTELWLVQPFEDLLNHELQRHESANPDADDVDIWVLIDNIVDKVSNEAGTRYENAVRRCLYCDFDRRSVDFEDEGFYDVFCLKAVGQLEETHSFPFQFAE